MTQTTAQNTEKTLESLHGLLGANCSGLLASYTHARVMAAPFADSTHQIWFLQGKGNRAILKLADLPDLGQQVFWQGVEQLFAWDIATDYLHLEKVYAFFAEIQAFESATCVGCCRNDSQRKAAILSGFVEGQTVDASRVSERDCRQLAVYLGEMHTKPQQEVSALAKSEGLNFDEFRRRIIEFIATAPLLKQLSSMELVDLLAQAQRLQTERLVPMVLDLRWDQFVKNGAGDLILLDLDAAVNAPLEMDWLMLETVLSASQIRIVVLEYKQRFSMPSRESLQQVRLLYRALFCGIGLLGEQEWSWWRSLPPILDDIID